MARESSEFEGCTDMLPQHVRVEDSKSHDFMSSVVGQSKNCDTHLSDERTVVVQDVESCGFTEQEMANSKECHSSLPHGKHEENGENNGYIRSNKCVPKAPLYTRNISDEKIGFVGSLRPEKSIPDAILRQAKGLAILTVMKVGVIVTYNIGTGLVVARREDGSWSRPSAISSFGLGWGAQTGGEFTDFIVVLRSNDAVNTFSGDVHLSVGAGLSAAVGIVGRTAEVDVRAGSGGFDACYTYSCSKGAFLGCSLEGSVVTTRVKENSRFYGSQSLTASDILLGSLPKPPAAATLYRALADLYQKFHF